MVQCVDSAASNLALLPLGGSMADLATIVESAPICEDLLEKKITEIFCLGYQR